MKKCGTLNKCTSMLSPTLLQALKFVYVCTVVTNYLHASVHVLVDFFLQTLQVDGRILIDLILVGVQDVLVRVLQRYGIKKDIIRNSTSD